LFAPWYNGISELYQNEQLSKSISTGENNKPKEMNQVLRMLYCLPILLLLLLRADEANGKGICLYFSEKTVSRLN